MDNPDDPKRDPAAADLHRLAQRWFADARQASAQDEAEVAAWAQEQRKWSQSRDGWGDWSLAGWRSSSADGDACGGDSGGCD
jgi:hypothetical protein